MRQRTGGRCLIYGTKRHKENREYKFDICSMQYLIRSSRDRKIPKVWHLKNLNYLISESVNPWLKMNINIPVIVVIIMVK